MKVISGFKKYWFLAALLGVLFLATFLRFYNYTNRWGLAYDQSHDFIVAEYALNKHKLPLLGPFSSAGPFQTGGEWYWFIMLGILLFPFTVLGPWILLTLFQVLFVLGAVILGKKIVDKPFGLLVGLLVAVSPVEISQSVNLTNQSVINILSLLALWFAIVYQEKKNSFFIFLLGLSIGTAVTVHLQGAGLSFLVMFVLIFFVRKWKHFFFLFLGLLIPLIPIYIIDSQYNFFTTRGFLRYYLHDQYQVSFNILGRNWRTYLFSFWPISLGNILNGNIFSGYFAGSLMILIISYKIFRKNISKIWLIILAESVGFIFLLRYLRTPLYDSYLMFAHPFIFLLVGISIYSLIRKQLIIGIVCFLIIFMTALYKDVSEMGYGRNYTAERSSYWTTFLQEKFPQKKFILYDYNNKSGAFVYPLVMYMQRRGILDDNGYKIGFGRPLIKDDPVNYKLFSILEGNKDGFFLSDLNSSSSAQLQKLHWAPVSPKLVYISTEEWYKNK